MSAVEIICRECGADALLQREAVYEGFSKVAERLSCSACGFEYADEADVPFKEKTAEPVIFTEADRSKKIKVFNGDENQRLCRYCAHYIINPFTQFCSVHKKEVQATDTCTQFKKAKPKDASNKPLF